MRASQVSSSFRMVGRARAACELLAIRRREARLDRLVVELHARALGQAEPCFDQPELQRLKPRGGKQVVAEIEKIGRRHRLQHVELGDQELEDLVDARERMHDARHRLVVDRIGRKIPLDAVELVQHLLEPELVGLVDDDEQHLVMHRRPVLGALGGLQGQAAGRSADSPRNRRADELMG